MPKCEFNPSRKQFLPDFETGEPLVCTQQAEIIDKEIKNLYSLDPEELRRCRSQERYRLCGSGGNLYGRFIRCQAFEDLLLRAIFAGRNQEPKKPENQSLSRSTASSQGLAPRSPGEVGPTKL
jgi:hypothetical protein